MLELRLLSPCESSLLLFSKEELPGRREQRQILKGRVPFPLTGCTVRRGRRSLPGSEGRLPILLVRPPGDRCGSARRGVWVHPLLFFLLFRRSGRRVEIAWKTHREPSPVQLRPSSTTTPRKQLLRCDALLGIARRNRVALLREILFHLRLLPVLVGLEGAPPAPGLLPALSLAMAIFLGFSSLLETRTPGNLEKSPPGSERSAEALVAGDEERLLQTLSILLQELDSVESAGMALSVVEIEGDPGVLHMRIRADEPEAIAERVSATFPGATIASESSNSPLAEAAGSLTLTLLPE